MNFKIEKIIITFKKYLKTIHGQSVLEYSLLLIVIAALSIVLISSLRDEGPISGAVDNINRKATIGF